MKGMAFQTTMKEKKGRALANDNAPVITVHCVNGKKAASEILMKAEPA